MLFSLIVSVALLLGMVRPFHSSTMPPAGDTSQRQLVLEDFDGDWQTRRAWHTPTGMAGSHVQLTQVNTPGEVIRGKAMHLRYAFTNPALDLAQDGLHSQAAVLHVRLSLSALDASTYDTLAFWIKGDAKHGFATTLEVGFRRPAPDLAGAMQVGGFRVTDITDRWQRIEIPLNLMTGIHEWKHLSEFFLSLHPRSSPAPSGAYSIDEIMLIGTGDRGPSVTDAVPTPIKDAWEAALGGRRAVQARLKDLLTGWPQVALIDPSTLPTDDHAFLWRLARDTWRGLVAMANRPYGLPIDNVRFRRPSVALDDSAIGDYTNITNIGLQLITVAAAHTARLVTEAQAINMLKQTLTSLERLETFAGFFYNYYDTTSLERASHYLSFVDSAWLTAGLITVRNAFPALHERCTRLITQSDYRLFLDPLYGVMFQGYHVNLARPAAYHYGLLYTEARLGSLIAIGKGDAPPGHWFKLHRTLPDTPDSLPDTF